MDQELIDYVDAEDRPVVRGPRGGAGARGLHYRVAATVLTDRKGRVLVYRRTDAAPVLPGHHDVLLGGSVRAGEGYAAAAARELAEEFGLDMGPDGLREVCRERAGSPFGPCWLTVHHARAEPGRLGAAAAAEVAWHGFLPLRQVLADPPLPFDDVGLRVLRRLAAAPPPGDG